MALGLNGISGVRMSGKRSVAASVPTPDQIDNLVVWVRSDFGLYQDTAGTTPATAENHNVARWNDYRDNGIFLTNPSAPSFIAKLRIDDFASGVNAVQFLNGILLTTSEVSISRRNQSVYVVVKRNDYTRALIANTYTVAGDNTSGYLSLNTGWQRPAEDNLTNFITSPIGHPFGEYAILSKTNDAAGVTFGVNERTGFTDRLASDVSDVGVGLGVANAPCNFHVVDYLVYNRALDANEHAAVMSYLNGRYGITTPERTHNLIFHGDSITKGFTAVQRPFADVAAVGAGVSEYDYLNYGDPGSTAASLATAAETLAPSLYRAGIPNIACVFAGTNDNANNVAVATIQASYQALCEEWQAAGFEVLAFTMMDRSGIFANGQDTTGFRTAKSTFNSWLRSNYGTFADAIVDPGDDANLGVDGASDSTTYFNGDKVHPNQLGHATLGALVATELTSMLA